jgi:Holliday junction DNA helicase RuvB
MSEPRIQTPAVLEGEDDLDRSLRPRRLDEFVGQEALREQLAVSLEATAARGEALDHVLLAGPPGLGKTSLAQILAAELDVPFVQTAGPALERKGDIASLLTALEPRSVFFVDEIHRLNRGARGDRSTRRWRTGRLPITIGQGAGRRWSTLEPPAVHAHRRDDARRPADDAAARPLRPPAPLEPYGPADLGADRAPLRADPGLSISTTGARGRSPRAAAARRAWPTACSARVRDWAEVRGSGVVDAPPAGRRRSRCSEVDELGLDRLDREILGAICERFGGGPVGLSTLAVAVGEEPTRSRTSTSPTSCRRLLQRTPRGRAATRRAYAAPRARRRTAPGRCSERQRPDGQRVP